MDLTNDDLPDKDDPGLYLTQATAAEIDEITQGNSSEWKGALSVEAYYRREAHLLDQDLTRQGGLTAWALVYGQGESRTVLSSCETIRKKALVAQRDGQIVETISHGIGSVFCPPKYRGRGYGGTMMKLLGDQLRTWQTEADNPSKFSVLYSDIGKKFYTARGWHPFPSLHISLPPKDSTSPSDLSKSTDLPKARPLYAADLPALCAADETLLRHRLQQKPPSSSSNSNLKTKVALLADHATISWHQARENFVSAELYPNRGIPSIKGAIVDGSEGHRVWCYFLRAWHSPDSTQRTGNELHILRLVIEDPGYRFDEVARVDEATSSSRSSSEEEKEEETKKAIAACLSLAQSEAHKWNMAHVELWNPTSTTLAAARLLEPVAAAKMTAREEESVASLKWYGDAKEAADPVNSVEWFGNEKYGWC